VLLRVLLRDLVGFNVGGEQRQVEADGFELTEVEENSQFRI
jgi:hypothetical protein